MVMKRLSDGRDPGGVPREAERAAYRTADEGNDRHGTWHCETRR
jgi:hypothetical protein